MTSPRWHEQLFGSARARSLLRFAAVAALSGGLYASFCAVLIKYLSIDQRIATVLAYVSSMIFNYMGHRFYTFDSSGSYNTEIMKYIIVHTVNIICYAAIMHVSVFIVKINFLYAMIISIIFVPILNYIIFDRWVFPESSRLKNPV